MKRKLTLTEESKNTLLEHPEEAKNWIAALRSGKYVQARKFMVNPEIVGSACCLMVACMVNHGLDWVNGIGYKLPSPIGGMPRWYENLAAKDGSSSPLVKHPASWNDHLKLSFDQISDLLEFGEVEYEPVAA